MQATHDERWRADAELARSAASGEEGARRRVAERLLDHVRRRLRKLAYADQDYDDMVTEAMIEVLRSLGSFQGRCTLETWSDRIAVRSAIRYLKRRQRKGQVVQLFPAEERAASADFRQELDARATQQRLSLILDELAPDRRAAIVLKLVHGYSVKEIADLTATTENTVRDRLRAARRHVRKMVLRDPGLSALVAGGTP